MRLELTHDQRKRFFNGLRTAYDQGTLGAMLDERLGRRLDMSLALPQPWSNIPSSLHQRAYMESWNGDLILASSAYAPHDADLARLVLELGLSAAGPGRLSVALSVRAKDDSLGSLEGLVKKSSELQDIAVFIAALTRLQYQVCRIETGIPPLSLGTGFLVGADLILTNWHVAEAIATCPEKVGCRFDYHADAAGLEVQKGFVVSLASENWLLRHRPYAESDVDRNGAPPKSTDLDYALIRIAKPVASFAPGKEAPIAGLPGRSFMRLDESGVLPRVNEELFVLQHPSGQPMKLAVGQVVESVGESAAPLRLRHDSTTEGGSSGSPCFNANLKLVALHHATDPENLAKPKFNQAIPISLIQSDLMAAEQLR